jgi:hypothetical protein
VGQPPVHHTALKNGTFAAPREPQLVGTTATGTCLIAVTRPAVAATDRSQPAPQTIFSTHRCPRSLPRKPPLASRELITVDSPWPSSRTSWPDYIKFLAPCQADNGQRCGAELHRIPLREIWSWGGICRQHADCEPYTNSTARRCRIALGFGRCYNRWTAVWLLLCWEFGRKAADPCDLLPPVAACRGRSIRRGGLVPILSRTGYVGRI